MKEIQNMGDENETPAISPEEKFEKEIIVEIGKLEYYLDDIDELMESDDIREIKVTSKRTDKILDRLNKLVLKTQELKLEKEHTQRSRNKKVGATIFQRREIKTGNTATGETTMGRKIAS